MKKIKILSIVLALVMVVSATFALTACNQEDVLWVGNTAATTGAFAGVGVPFNIALEAYLNYYNEELRGEGDQIVKLKHYDDGFDAAKGLSYTEKLVEDDKVFALVGHFGTPTVGATLNYIKEQKIPMVYAATGISALYNAEAKGDERYIFPVQPIFPTEGEALALRAVAPNNDGTLVEGFPTMDSSGLGLKKIGIIYTNDDAGNGIYSGVSTQVDAIKKIAGYSDVVLTASKITDATTDAAAALASLKDAGVECLIVAANQAPATSVINAMPTAGLDVPILTSYVNANATFIGDVESALVGNRTVYANAWVDVISTTGVAGLATFYEIMENHAVMQGDYTCEGELVATNTKDIRTNSYAMAGFIAGATFVEGLIRTIEAAEVGEDGKKVITKAAFVDALEDGALDLPMVGAVDFTNGSRKGVQSFALFAYNAANKENAVSAYVDNVASKLFRSAGQLLASLTD